VNEFLLLVMAILAPLGSPDYRVRERASRFLAQDVDRHLPVLLIGERSRDAEIAHRCRILANRYYLDNAEELSYNIFPRGMKYLPPLSLPNAFDQEGYLYQTFNPPEFYDEEMPFETYCDYLEATRLWLQDRIALRQPYEAQLNQMAADHLGNDGAGPPWWFHLFAQRLWFIR
jgi:hypothetical protein